MSKPKRPQPTPASIQKTAHQCPTHQTRAPQAPPPYRPQAIPKCLQPKAATPRPKPLGGVNAAPSPPPVYRPQPLPKVLQRKSSDDHRQPLVQQQQKPTPAPPSRLPPGPKVLQPKTAIVPPRSGTPHEQARRRPVIQRMQPINFKDSPVTEELASWPEVGAVQGQVWRAQTDKGNLVPVWVAHNTQDKNERYFCHGHALGTYEKYGYTVLSGEGLKTVLRDEYKEVMWAQAGVGDLVVWFNKTDLPVHSAILTKFQRDENNRFMRDQTTLSSKNGKLPVAELTLEQLVQTYGDDYRFFKPA